jgi:hypothetical protein
VQDPVGAAPFTRYIFQMTREQVKAILDRVLSWPAERQQDAAEILMGIEAQDKSEYQLSDEQLAELRRRRAEKDPKAISLAEFDQRLRRFGV